MTELEEDAPEALVRGHVIDPMARAALVDLPSRAKAVGLAAEAMKWSVSAWRSTFMVAEVLYLADSPQDAKDPHQAGEVRFPACSERRYWVEARHPEAALGFRALWAGKGEGSGGDFDHAIVVDPLGIPVENYVDYTIDKTRARELQWSERQRVEHGRELNFRINDGSSRMEKRYLFHKATDFMLWMDDWLTQLAPDHKTLAPKTRVKKTVDEQLLSGEDWHG